MHVFFLQKLKEDMALLDPQIDEFLKSSDSLLDDNDLPDKDQQTVERESELLEKRWNKVKNDANSRESRFVCTIKLHLSAREFRARSLVEFVALCSFLRLYSSSAFPHRSTHGYRRNVRRAHCVWPAMTRCCHFLLQKLVPVLSGPSGFNRLDLNCFYASLSFLVESKKSTWAYRSVKKPCWMNGRTPVTPLSSG